jgi:glycopeptide antibiotics resistance protein
MMSNSIKTMKKHLISTVTLLAYSMILIMVMVFKIMPLITIGSLRINFGGTQAGVANLLPFKTILPYLLGEKGWLIAGINLVGNIALLVPIGFLVPFIYRHMTWKKSLTLAVAAGFAIEGTQALLHVGIFDIDDVILNALGVMIGYWAFAILVKWMRPGKYKNIIIIAVIVIVAVVAALYAVYPKGQQPVNSVRGAENSQPGNAVILDTAKPGIPQGVDPCNGTGGTGQIVRMGNSTITIKRNDGISEIINLTNKTTIRNSAGAISKSDLKIGDRVTVVVMSHHTATVVVVCNASSSKQVK